MLKGVRLFQYMCNTKLQHLVVDRHYAEARQSVKCKGAACCAEIQQDETINEVENHLMEEED